MPVVTDYTAILADADERWNAYQGDGAPVIVTYNFVTTNFQAILSESSLETLSGFNAFDAAQQLAFRAALDEFEAVAGIRFVEVDDPADAMIRVMNSADEALRAGFANYPTISDNTSINYTSVSSNGALVMTQGTGVDYSPGTYQYETLLHEIGHAVGLEHPFSGDITLDPSVDDNTNTVMTYTNNPVVDDLGVFDIQALQQIYGASTGLDDFTYSWNETTDVFTLTGGAGNDVLIAVDADSAVNGGDGDDTMFGRDGDDTFTPGEGDATVAGGTGDDTLVLSGSISDYVLSRGGGIDGLVITGNGGASVEGRVSLRSIDNIVLTDDGTTLTLDAFKAAILPDLTITGGLGNLGDLTVGVDRNITLSILNNSTQTASFDKDGSATGPLVKVFLKVGDSFSNDGIEIGQQRAGVLVGGASEQLTVTLNVPDFVPAGSDYRLYFVFDGNDEVLESNESNNQFFFDMETPGFQVINASPQPAPTDIKTVTVDQYESGNYLNMFRATLVEGEYGYINQFSMVYEAVDGSGVTAVLTGHGFTQGGTTGTITGLAFHRDGALVMEAQGYDIAQSDAVPAVNLAKDGDFSALSALLNDYVFDYTGSDGAAETDDFVGTLNDDTISGGAGDDTLAGGQFVDPNATVPAAAFTDDGDDSIDAGAGDDLVIVGGGRDTLDGGSDTDTLAIYVEGVADWAFSVDYDLSTGEGFFSDIAGVKDTISGFEHIVVAGNGAINATLTGDGGANMLAGAVGHDTLDGAGDDDTLSGGAGDDILSGGDGNDELLGGDGDDTLNSGDDSDFLSGGAGNDFFNLGEGSNNVLGDDGADVFQIFEGGINSLFDFNITRDELRLNPLGLTVADINALTPTQIAPDLLRLDIGDGVIVPLTTIFFYNLTLADWDSMDVRGTDGLREGVDPVATVVELDTQPEAFDAIVLGALLPEPVDTIVNPARTQIEVITSDGLIVQVDGHYLEIDETTGDALGGVITSIEVREPQVSGPDIILTRITGLSMELVAFAAALDAARDENEDPINDLFGVYRYDITGSSAGEELTYSSDLDDTINAGGGDDLVEGDGGDDSLLGEAGNDTLDGGDGDDTLDGGADDDVLRAGAGDNVLTGGAGVDRFVAPNSNVGPGTPISETVITDFNLAEDIFLLEGLPLSMADGFTFDEVLGNLRIQTSPYDFVIFDGITLAERNQIMIEGNDGTQIGFATGIDFTGDGTGELIDGDALNDTLDGAGGNDTLDGKGGDDILSGGDGDDTLVLSTGSDTIDGGADTDTLLIDLTNATPGDFDLTVDLATGSASSPESPSRNTTLINIENVTQIGMIDVTLKGDSGANALTSGGGDDTLVGGNGADTLSGNDGADLLRGEIGDDSLSGGDGNDGLSGGDGADTLEGGIGNDSLFGNDGLDSLDGGSGDDFLDGQNGADFMSGGADNDRLKGASGNDTLNGDGGTDTLFGGSGADIMNGGAGDDLHFGEDDNDSIDGAGGNDTLNGNAGNDTLNGGDDADTIQGGIGDDVLSGDEGADILRGQNGNDDIMGGLGNDTILAGTGNDTVDGGAGDDTIYAGTGDDSLLGGADNDLIEGDAGFDTLDGGAGNDTLNGGTFGDTLIGGTGDDVLRGEVGNDSLLGGEGNDTLNGGDKNDTLDGGIGDDNLFGDIGLDRLFGGDGSDTLDGGDGNDVLRGQNDADKLLGRAGADKLFGGTGDDTLNAGSQNDELYGEEGADTLRGDAGDDTLEGGADDDRLIGGTGADEFVFSTGDGADLIVDFSTTDDLLDVTGLGLGSADLNGLGRSDTAGGLLIDFGNGDSLTLQGVTDAESDFITLITNDGTQTGFDIA